MNLIYQGAFLLASRVDAHQTGLYGTCKVMGDKVALLYKLIPEQRAALDHADSLLIIIRTSTADLPLCARRLGELLQTFQDLWSAVPASSDAAAVLCQLDNRVKNARALVADWMRQVER
jgi:hypothetical protein